jgi:hypothetical protein
MGYRYVNVAADVLSIIDGFGAVLKSCKENLSK